jgi:hypothetical protein
LVTKQLGLLRDFPGVARVAVLVNPTNVTAETTSRAAEATALFDRVPPPAAGSNKISREVFNRPSTNSASSFSLVRPASADCPYPINRPRECKAVAHLLAALVR